MSYIGEQFVSPSGYKGLISSRRYYFLGYYGDVPRAIICFFKTDPPRVFVEIINGEEFENALLNGNVVPAEKQVLVPPWLSKLEGVDFSTLNDKRYKDYKKSHEDMVDERYGHIEPLLSDMDRIFDSLNPERAMNKIIRYNSPSQNVTRVRCWFLCYLCFGRTKWALMPLLPNIGNWDREKISPDTKLGCPSKYKGKNSGYTVNSNMKENIYDGYRKFSKLGESMEKIYGKSLTKYFKCKVRKVENNKREYYQPENKPIPSIRQFRYWVYKKFGKEAVQLKLYGETRIRNRNTESKGKYSEGVTNLLQNIVGDAYYLKEVPKGFRDGEMMPPLCVVRLRDVLSGYFVGIGFSIGAEKADAYRMALFCMAIDKELFCSFFGLEDTGSWISKGLPSSLKLDRGPGSILDLIKGEDAQIPIRDMSPSYSGQSNAVVESSHPRDIKIEGKPSFIASNHNYVELAQREILRTIADNERIDVSSRLTPYMTTKIPLPNPLCVWEYFDKRSRTNAYQISFDEAVRSFLPKLDFTVNEDGLYLYRNRFDSKELRKTGVCHRTAGNDDVKISCHVLVLSLRHIWADIKGRIVQANAKPAIRVDEKELFISLEELRRIKEIQNKMNSEFRDNRIAVQMEMNQKFKNQTGKDWDSGTRRSGRKNRSKRSSSKEFSNIKKVTAG